MKKFCVIGNPIDHSLSPKLHNFWFKKNRIDAIYEKRLVEEKEIPKLIESIRNSAAEKGLEFNIPWQGYRQPNMFADSTPYGTSYVHPTRGTLILAGFNLLGMAEKYHIGGDRGGTTAADPKGTGDADQ